ncbi:hypothetical protein BC829DRAFT_382987 [Chytridium lagenaria]|nr:hypothetical protein BC829DRAFT_382987 [Chytridium lagenaria]
MTNPFDTDDTTNSPSSPSTSAPPKESTISDSFTEDALDLSSPTSPQRTFPMSVGIVVITSATTTPMYMDRAVPEGPWTGQSDAPVADLPTPPTPPQDMDESRPTDPAGFGGVPPTMNLVVGGGADDAPPYGEMALTPHKEEGQQEEEVGEWVPSTSEGWGGHVEVDEVSAMELLVGGENGKGLVLGGLQMERGGGGGVGPYDDDHLRLLHSIHTARQKFTRTLPLNPSPLRTIAYKASAASMASVATTTTSVSSWEGTRTMVDVRRDERLEVAERVAKEAAVDDFEFLRDDGGVVGFLT